MKERSVIIYEDSENMAFMDKNPFNLGHVLVIPKKHYRYIIDMTEKEICKLFRVVHRLSKAIFYARKVDGLNIGQSNGEAASQQVFHVHVHIIPRFERDSIKGTFPNRKKTTIHELEKTAESILTVLNKNNYVN